jgi:hypothetical protein
MSFYEYRDESFSRYGFSLYKRRDLKPTPLEMRPDWETEYTDIDSELFIKVFKDRDPVHKTAFLIEITEKELICV